MLKKNEKSLKRSSSVINVRKRVDLKKSKTERHTIFKIQNDQRAFQIYEARN